MLMLKDGRLQWEVLLGGSAALVAAIIGYTAIRWQAEDQRRRRGRAAQAVLPLMLSELFDYLTGCTDGLLRLKACDQDGQLPWGRAIQILETWQRPRLPENCASILKECIEFSEPGVGEAMTDLLSLLQIQYARIESTCTAIENQEPGRVFLTQNVRTYLLDTVEIRVRTSKLLDMARGKKDVVDEVTSNDIMRSLMQMTYFENDDDILLDMARCWLPALDEVAEMQSTQDD